MSAGLRKDGLGILLPVSRGISRDADPKAAAHRLRDAINLAKKVRDMRPRCPSCCRADTVCVAVSPCRRVVHGVRVSGGSCCVVSLLHCIVCVCVCVCGRHIVVLSCNGPLCAPAGAQPNAGLQHQ